MPRDPKKREELVAALPDEVLEEYFERWIETLSKNMSTEWGLYGASSIIVTIPVVVLFLLLSRYLISGLTLGSVKG